MLIFYVMKVCYKSMFKTQFLKFYFVLGNTLKFLQILTKLKDAYSLEGKL